MPNRKNTDQESDKTLRKFYAQYGDQFVSCMNNQAIEQLTESERQELIERVKSTCPMPLSNAEMKKALFIELCKIGEAKRQEKSDQ